MSIDMTSLAFPKQGKKPKKEKKRIKPVSKNKGKIRVKLDKMVGFIVRSRGICENENCISVRNKKTPVLQWAHIISRSYKQVRWDFDNAFCLCHACHFFYTTHPLEWEAFVVAKIGKEKYEDLKQRAMAFGKFQWEKKVDEITVIYDKIKKQG